MNIIITGAGRGIGFDTVLELSKDPANKIIALSRNQESLIRLQKEARTNGHGNVDVYQFDVSSFEQAAVDRIAGRYGCIDILINNAAQLINRRFLDTGLLQWKQLFNANLFGVVELIKALFPYLMESKLAHIVNVGSMGGFQGTSKFPGLSSYSASKAALANLTECLAQEFDSSKIRVNCLALGSVNTEMLNEAFPGYTAPVNSAQMARYIAGFSLNAHHFLNGKIIPVSLTTP